MRTSKKIVSLVLAVMMLASMMVVGAVSVSAATTVSTSAELYAAAKAGGDIVVANDITLDGNCGNNYNYDLLILHPTTIDLGGHKVTTYAANTIGIYNGSNLTIKNGTMEVMNQDYGLYGASGSTVTVLGNATINTKEGFFLSKNTTTNIYGKVTATNWFAIGYNGTTSTGYVLNIYEGAWVEAYNPESAGIYHCNQGTLNVYGGTIKGATAVIVKSGATNISGGTFIGNGTATEFQHNGNGGNSTGDAILVESCNYPGGTPAISITGGIFESVNAAPVAAYTQNAEQYVEASNFIEGGEFTGAEETDANLLTAAAAANVVTSGNTKLIGYTAITDEAGFADACENGGNYYLANDIEITATEDGAYTIAPGTELTINLGGKTITTNPYVIANKGKLTITGEGTISAPKGVVDNYGELVIAGGTLTNTEEKNVIWNNAGASVVVGGGTIAPTAGIGINNQGGTVTLNRGSIESTADGAWGVYNANADSSLTVNGGKIEVTGNKPYGVQNNGTVTVNGGEILADSSGWGIATYSNTTVTVNGGTITGGYAVTDNGNESDFTININGGTITGADLGVYHPGNGVLNITGGTITGGTAVYSKSGATNISGGTFKAVMQPGESYDYYGNGGNPTGDAIVIDNCNYPGGAPSVNITGGNFETTDSTKDAVHSYVQSDDDNLPANVSNPTTNEVRIGDFISGGTFSSDVTAYCTEDFVAEKQADGTYGIVEDPLAEIAEIEGYQQKITGNLEGNDINTQGVRIYTSFDKTALGENDDYGYVVAKYSGEKTQAQLDFSVLNTTSGNGQHVISCKGSSNNTKGEDYVTLAVNGMTDGQKVVARFYVVKNGVTYYAKYVNVIKYDGILATYTD